MQRRRERETAACGEKTASTLPPLPPEANAKGRKGTAMKTRTRKTTAKTKEMMTMRRRKNLRQKGKRKQMRAKKRLVEKKEVAVAACLSL